jgi:ankyrin repeat protein
MFPNPQEALPLPPRPRLEHYKKRAKDLVKVCKSDRPDGIQTWAEEWMKALAVSWREAGMVENSRVVEQYTDKIAEFARTGLKSDRNGAGCALADAQFVIARVQGFTSWPKFASHLKALASETSDESAFEAAADAIVDGDVTRLRKLLRADSGLIRARSPREHRAMLLHYISANGVENYRQRTPQNAVEIAETLLSAGAEVNADADVYGGGATTLGLVATSCHPHNAGVQNALIDVLLKHGAPLDDPQGAGNKHNLVNGCLANGRGEAAEYLARLGAPLDLEGAAGVGRLDIVKRFFDDEGNLRAGATDKQMSDGFSWACAYGRMDVVRFLADKGLAVNAKLRPHGQTGLHSAALGGHVDIVRLLLERNADVRAIDTTFGTTPLLWALYSWSEEPHAPSERYSETVSVLVAAGSAVKPEWRENEKLRPDPRMLAALGFTTRAQG